MGKKGTRVVSDSMGDIQVPQNALYGAQTQRALNNFKISNLTLPSAFIRSLAEIKKCAAHTNAQLGELNEDLARAIIDAADQVIAGKHVEQFAVDVFQTGSGTSSNMNINEVLAGICQSQHGLTVHPNDHVNMGQSSNDVIPTAIQLAAVTQLHTRLLPAFAQLSKTLDTKARESQDIIKTGRTHLMDAMPISLAQELLGWKAQVEAGTDQLLAYMPNLTALAQGGTAVGTGVNSHPQFAERFAQNMSAQMSGTLDITFSPSSNFFKSIGSQDLSVGLAGHLRVLATTLYKISTDLRWMNSGPLAGLGEIELQALQPGSSIMPGKVNPIIPEAVSMACAQVVGNDATISMAGMSGNFQLNTMLPVIAYNLLQSIDLLTNSAHELGTKCIANFTINHKNINATIERNPILATALAPKIGYEAAAKIAKIAYQTQQPILDVAIAETDLDAKELRRLLDPKHNI